MENDGKEKAFRFVAYTAITFSVVAILSVCVTFPMVYNYVASLEDMVNEDAEYCTVIASFFDWRLCSGCIFGTIL